MSPGFLKRTLYRCHFVFGAVLGALAFVAISGTFFVYAVLRKGRGQGALMMARAFHYTVTTLLGWRITVENKERLKQHTPCIYMIGHQSNLDIVVHGGIYPANTVVLGKLQIAQIPVFGWFFIATRNILIDRGDLAKAIESIRRAAERVREEKISVWVFPEGHRNQKAELLPFKKGVFHLAIAAQVPIVPIIAEPLGRLMNAKRWMNRPGRLRVRILPAIPSEGLNQEDVDRLMTQVRASMQAAQDKFFAEAKPTL